MNEHKTITVIGATGMLGAPVARRLQKDGFRVRIMSRDGTKARKSFDDSFEIITGDAQNASDLENALEDCHGVHINLRGASEPVVAKLVGELAPRTDIRRITYISGATVSAETSWFSESERKYQAEQAIAESGVPYTIFKPTWFMEALPNFVQRGRATVIGNQVHPFHWLAADDYARMVSTAYQKEEAANKRFFIDGPESIRISEALQRYCAACHPEIENVSNMPIWMARLMATLMRNNDLKSAAALMAYFEKVKESGDPTEANSILGAPVITLDAWLAKQPVNEERS